MSKNSIRLFKNIVMLIATAVAALLVVNAIAFLIPFAQKDWIGDVHFKHGIFYLNGQAKGLVWGEPITHVFLLVVFIVALLLKYRKGQFK